MAQTQSAHPRQFQLAPGEVVIVRDAEWIVTNTEQSTSGTLVRCIGLSELVRDTSVAFHSRLDHIEPLNPSEAKVVPDWGVASEVREELAGGVALTVTD